MKRQTKNEKNYSARQIKRVSRYLEKESRKTLIGVIAISLLALAVMFLGFAASCIIWYYCTTVDILYLAGCYLTFGMLFNMFIISLFKRWIDKFIEKRKAVTIKNSSSVKGIVDGEIQCLIDRRALENKYSFLRFL